MTAVEQQSAYRPDPPADVNVARFNIELLKVSVPNPAGRWLHCYWEPGFPWYPVGRWVIAEVTPRWVLAKEDEFYESIGERDTAGATAFSELEGPDPWLGGHWCADGHCSCEKKLNRFAYRSGPDGQRIAPSITHRQWELYREIGGLAKPIWIVQGTRGGHKRFFNAFEQAILRIRRQPIEAPVPGDLPYAPPDERTLAALREAQRLAKVQAQFNEDWAYRVGREEKSRIEGISDAERALYKEWSSWIDDQVDNRLSR